MLWKLCLLLKFQLKNLFLMFFHRIMVAMIDLILLIFPIHLIYLEYWKYSTHKSIKDNFSTFEKCQWTMSTFYFFMVKFLCLVLLADSLTFFANCSCYFSSINFLFYFFHFLWLIHNFWVQHFSRSFLLMGIPCQKTLKILMLQLDFPMFINCFCLCLQWLPKKWISEC